MKYINSGLWLLTLHHMKKILDCMLIEAQGFLVVFGLVLFRGSAGQINGFLLCTSKDETFKHEKETAFFLAKSNVILYNVSHFRNNRNKNT